jgi:hypothetical protein
LLASIARLNRQASLLKLDFTTAFSMLERATPHSVALIIYALDAELPRDASIGYHCQAIIELMSA